MRGCSPHLLARSATSIFFADKRSSMNINKFFSFGISGAVAFTFLCTCPFAVAQESSAKQSPDSASLLKQIARHNDMEMAFAEMGARKAQNPDLKRYCLQIQDQQKQFNSQLKPVQEQHGLTLNQTLTSTDQMELTQLGKQFGEKFDSTLAKCLMREQRQNISQLQLAANNSDPAISKYANEALPQIRQQLEKTQTLAANVRMNQPIAGSAASTNEARGGSEGPK
jgi:predicted outer membrane protein